MAKLQKEAELFESIARDDILNAKKTAESICDELRRRGNHLTARRLQAALNRGKSSSINSQRQPENGALVLPVSMNGAMSRLPAGSGLKSVVLADATRSELKSVIIEWQSRDLLQKHHLPRRTKLLFFGPPGCGKSLTARALGAEMAMPVFLVRFDAIIGAYLGQTAVNLRQLFLFVESTPCILLLDEIDAIGKTRGSPSDVGELDRVVISLMQELEHAAPRGLVIATSNIPEKLDRALWRRFDTTIVFPKPKPHDLLKFAKRIASNLHVPFTQDLLRKLKAVTNFADAEKEIISRARRELIASQNSSRLQKHNGER